MKNYPFIFALLLCWCSCRTPEKPADPAPSKEAAVPEIKPVSTGPVYGIDISVYQGDEVDFLHRKKDSLGYVLCKATEGLTMTDPDFKTNWSMIEQKGFIRGAYHFYHCTDDAVAQANFFLSVLGKLSPGDLPPIVDVEEFGMTCKPSPAVINALLTFLKTVKTQTGRTPIIYTDNNTANAQLNDPAFAGYPLYIADWSGDAKPLLPQPWNTWTFWQKSDDYSAIHSIANDLDVFNGDLQALKAFIEKN